MNLLIPYPFGWLLNKKAARVEVNISLAFFHWVGLAVHPWPFISDIALFVLKGDIKLQLTNLCLNVYPVSLMLLNYMYKTIIASPINTENLVWIAQGYASMGWL